MKKLVLLLCVLSAVGCVKSYEDYYTRSFVLSYGNMRGISVAMTDFGSVSKSVSGQAPSDSSDMQI